MRAILIAEDDEEWAYLQWRKEQGSFTTIESITAIPDENISIERAD